MNKREFEWEYNPHSGADSPWEADAVVGEYLYRVIVHQENAPENPWEAWDNQPPLAAVCGRDFHKTYGDADSPEIDKLTAEQVIQNHEAVDLALAPFFECNGMDAPDDPQSVSVLEMIYGNKVPEEWSQETDPLDVIREEIEHNYLSGSMDTEMLDRLEEVWNWLGITTFRDQVVGYSQGDWCEVLLVATPEWLEKSGVKPEQVDAALENAAELWGHYIFGDVYWCEIVRLERDAEGEVIGEECIDSCSGFYGPDFETSGLADYAREVLAGLEVA